jgi:hypothetical protein
MLFIFFLVGSLTIGWFVPQAILRHANFRFAGVLAVICALFTGALFIWIGAQAVGLLGFGDAKNEFERGFNAWKIMLFLAPASAIQAQRRKTTSA